MHIHQAVVSHLLYANEGSSATAEIARDADVGADSLSPVDNLGPFNSTTHYLFIIISVYCFA